MRSNFAIPALIVASLFGAALAPSQAEPTAGSKPVHSTAAMKAKKPTNSTSSTVAKPNRIAIQVDQNDAGSDEPRAQQRNRRHPNIEKRAKWLTLMFVTDGLRTRDRLQPGERL